MPRDARYFTEREYRQYDLIGPGILDDLSAKEVWAMTLSTANATRQTSNKFGLLSLLWQFCSYLFWPQRRPKDYYNL